MVSFTKPEPQTLLKGSPSDDLTDDLHRQLIGYIGLGLPAALYVIAGLRDTKGLAPWHLLGSISAYYYTGATAVFVGMLIALSLFLIAYHGYANEHHKYDRIFGVIAGLAAWGVALFPTNPPVSVPEGTVTAPATWWHPWVATVHYGSAITLFVMFAVFSLWLFRMGPIETPAQRLRNRLYLIYGILIVIGIVWAGYNGLHQRAIFAPETLAVVAFSASWLTKGKVQNSVRRLKMRFS